MAINAASETGAGKAEGGGRTRTRRLTSRRFLALALAVGLPLTIALALYEYSGGVKSGPTATPAEEEPEWVRRERSRADLKAFCAEGR